MASKTPMPVGLGDGRTDCRGPQKCKVIREWTEGWLGVRLRQVN